MRARWLPFALVLALPASAASPAPYRLSVAVEWGGGIGSESLRAALTEALVLDLRAARCLAAVDDAAASPGSGAPLVTIGLQLIVLEVGDETEFDYGAASLGSTQPDLAGRAVARAEGEFRAVARIEESVLREQRFRAAGSWRPLGAEDARAEAQRRLIEDAVRRVRRLVCRGGAQRWRAEVEHARGGGQPPAR